MITRLSKVFCFTTYLSLYLHGIFNFYCFLFLTFIFSFNECFWMKKHTFSHLFIKTLKFNINFLLKSAFLKR